MRTKSVFPAFALVASILLMIGSSALSDPVNLDDGHQCCRAPHPEALVLPADQFVGETAAAYAAAKQNSDICCKLFCYCGCDRVHGHTSLLECFIDDHSTECGICRDEALLALKLRKQKKTLGQIQYAIDKQYEKQLMFKVPSKALLEYRAKRQYKD